MTLDENMTTEEQRKRDAEARIVAEVEAGKDWVPRCDWCGRERDLNDAYDYNPIQVVTRKPLGWYSSEKDGEMCGQCMTKILKNQ